MFYKKSLIFTLSLSVSGVVSSSSKKLFWSSKKLLCCFLNSAKRTGSREMLDVFKISSFLFCKDSIEVTNELPSFVIPKLEEFPKVCIYMKTFPLFLLIYYVYIPSLSIKFLTSKLHSKISNLALHQELNLLALILIDFLTNHLFSLLKPKQSLNHLWLLFSWA